MTNIDRLAKHIAKYGEKSFLIHTIPKTKSWLVAQKVNNSKWRLIVMDPHSTVAHDLGNVDEKTYVEISEKITRGHIENIKQNKIKKELLSINQ
jgi:hypothetical protein